MAREWTPDEDALIEGRTNKQVSELLPHRSVAAIQKRREILGVGQPVAGITVQNMPPRTQNWPETHETPEHEEFIGGTRSRERGEDIAEYWAAMKQVMSVQVRRRQGVRNLAYDFGNEFVSIALFSDTHIGAMIDAERLEEDIRLIAETPGMYCIFLGDALDNFKAQGKTANGMYGTAIPSPKDQFEIAKLVFAPLKGKCLAFLEGNHDAWDYKSAGVDRLHELAESISAPYVTEAGASLKLRTGTETYQFNVKHQWKGASVINKSNVTRRFWEEYPEFDSADLVAIGHFHEPDYHQTMKRGEPVHLVKVGTYKLADGYSDALGFKSSYGVAVATLDPTEHRVRVDMSLDDGIRRLQSFSEASAA